MENSSTGRVYNNPKFEKWISKQPMRTGNGLSISDTVTSEKNMPTKEEDDDYAKEN